MAHHRYQTEAIVLGSVPRGESNRLFFIFTKDFGMIVAVAQGVRKISSKLKGGLSDFSHLDIDLIRGADMWRIVDITERRPPLSSVLPRVASSFARFSRLMRRLMHGERGEARLFSSTADFREFLMDEDMSKESLLSLEVAMAVKVLHELGYGGDEKEALFVHAEPLSHSLLSFVEKHRHTLVAFVNTRLRESHL